jgi:uncharacterized SAM-binding protein YcdF (DUF218 family)
MSEERPASDPRDTAAGLVLGALAGLLAHELQLGPLFSFHRDTALLVPIGAALGALAGAFRLRSLAAAAAGTLLALWLVIAFSPLCAWLARDLVRRDPLRPADAVFVLGSKVQDDGDLTALATTRLLRGLEILAQGHAPRLVIADMPGTRPSYEPATRELMRALRVPGELLMLKGARNTHDEAELAARLFRERGWRLVIVVTSPSHSQRATAAFERAGVAAISVPSEETLFDLEHLSRPGDRLAAFPALVHERLGLWVYRRRGWI